MKKLFAAIAMLIMLSSNAFGQLLLAEKLYTQEITYVEIAQTKNSADLGEISCGAGAVILWWTVEAGSSADYDVHFFTQDNAGWDADNTTGVDTDEMIYQKEGITTSWYKDDLLFPFVTTDDNNIMYVGIHNTGVASTFNLRVFWAPRRGHAKTTDTN